MQTPPCPQILTEAEEPLPVREMRALIEIHISTAFVTLQATFINGPTAGNRLLVVPMEEEGTVTKAEVRIRDRLIETIVVPTDDAKTLVVAKKRPAPNQVSPTVFDNTESYMPTIFRLPISQVLAGDEIHVEVTYFEPLFYSKGSLHLSVPLVIPPSMLLQPDPQSTLQIQCHINAGTTNCRWGSSSHPLKTILQDPSKISMEVDRSQPWEARPFRISYSILSNTILTNCLVEMIPDSYDAMGMPEGNFTIFVNPPTVDQGMTLFGRNIVFLLDRSLSMDGEPMQAAKAAINAALDNLKLTDNFTIIQFNHQMESFSPTLLQATPYNITAAKGWGDRMFADGGTDILTPVRHSLNLLRQHSDGIPFLVLVTDGCVQNERMICRQAQQLAGNTRILTFGIGPFCNTFFLKMLAQIGRGFSATALQCTSIFPKMVRLTQMAEEPILTDITVALDGVTGVEVYPFPIPDLYCGGPMVISGKFFGKPPAAVAVRGRFPNGQQLFQSVQAISSHSIPISKVFAKQRVDLYTSKAWLEDSSSGRKEVIEMSCAMSIPCAHTSFLAYETTPARKLEQEQQQQQRGPQRKISHAKRNLALAGGAAVGGAILVGAAIATFGDIGSTLGNIGIGGAMADLNVGGLFGDGGGGGCCGCDGCDACGDGCGDICDKFGDCLGSVTESVGSLFDSC